MVDSKKIRWLSIAMAVTLSVSLIVSLFSKEKWLWMDEVLSYMFISDPSLGHMNNAIVSAMDGNPPVSFNTYWIIAHLTSLNPQFLRAVSVAIFALTIALFYRYITRLIGTPTTNFVLITAIVAFTYLNLLLSTQLRGYSLYLLISLGYFVLLHRLITAPGQIRLLLLFCIVGVLLMLTHSFGLFFGAASGLFFAGLLLWSKDRRYLFVLAAHLVLPVAWLLIWYPNFVVQAEAGKPHSWIPVPTVMSFFSTVGELAPTVSSSLESRPLFSFLPILRFALVIGLWLYIALPRVKTGFRGIIADKPFLFYLMSGFIYMVSLGIALTISLTYTSVFISRYMWPNHLLLLYQLVYAFYFFRNRWSITSGNLVLLTKLLPLYMLLLGAFLFYQNRKVSLFPGGILSYMPQLDKRYPVFVETADYFLPMWFHDKTINVHYLLNWDTAVNEKNILQATVEYHVLKSAREIYHVPGIITAQEFTPATVPHFYVIDETSNYQIEEFIKTGQVQVIRTIPVAIDGHRIIECVFAPNKQQISLLTK